MVRQFDSGANRDLAEGKHVYHRFTSALVVDEFGRYMHEKSKLADGTLRDGDNWKKGIPQDAYLDSLDRHYHDLMMFAEGVQPVRPENGEKPTLIDTLMGLLFNVQGLSHEVLKGRADLPVSHDDCDSDYCTLHVRGDG